MGDGESKYREIMGLLLDVILAGVPAVVPMPTLWRWLVWMSCFGAFVLIVQFLKPLRSSLKSRTMVTSALIVVFVLAFWRTAYGQWREEQATRMSGHISAKNPDLLIFNPVVEWGNSGWIRELPSNGKPLSLFREAGIVFETSAEGMQISTKVWDREGHLVVSVDKNDWVVQPAYSIDHNYTSDALEVLDSGGHVVLQIHILADRIQLRGEWHDEFGHAAQITECMDSPGGCIGVFGKDWREGEKKMIVEPIFKYPSKEHWAEWR